MKETSSQGCIQLVKNDSKLTYAHKTCTVENSLFLLGFLCQKKNVCNLTHIIHSKYVAA